LNSGPLVPQTSALTRLRHAPSEATLSKLLGNGRLPRFLPSEHRASEVLPFLLSVRDTRSVQAGAAPDTIRVLLADTRQLFANAVETLLATHPRFELVGIAFDGVGAVELAIELEPEVVLIDADLPYLDGLEVTKRICEGSSPRMVILTGADSDLDAVEAHDAGAGAYLPKARSAADLLDTLEFTALLLDAADALPQP
jgi:CheY-like chemotaxis protein